MALQSPLVAEWAELQRLRLKAGRLLQPTVNSFDNSVPGWRDPEGPPETQPGPGPAPASRQQTSPTVDTQDRHEKPKTPEIALGALADELISTTRWQLSLYLYERRSAAKTLLKERMGTTPSARLINQLRQIAETLSGTELDRED
ncbi:hypothetical protein GCM10025867_46630 (plasmid) [Frondihabitans sucicola]|uniref:Uncharacterized protein n=1 Tax=Frondihabitans sucicola TaxID=1268041 RepID=A0ABN6Y511_9MICO|nr:hypothetical protein GCM10025867_46630 [Frondihabitans sucicola]